MNGTDLSARYDHAQRTIERLNQVLADLRRHDRDIAHALCSHKTYEALMQFVRDASLVSDAVLRFVTEHPIPDVIPVPLKIDDSIPYGILAIERSNWSGTVRFADLNVFALA